METGGRLKTLHLQDSKYLVQKINLETRYACAPFIPMIGCVSEGKGVFVSLSSPYSIAF